MSYLFWQMQYTFICAVSMSISFPCVKILVQTCHIYFRQTNTKTQCKLIWWSTLPDIFWPFGEFRTTRSEWWALPDFLQKSGLNCPTILALLDKRFTLLKKKFHHLLQPPHAWMIESRLCFWGSPVYIGSVK